MEQPGAGTQLSSAISSEVVTILGEESGDGPFTAKTYALDDLILVVADGDGLGEQTRGPLATRVRHAIEKLTGRSVWSTLAQEHPDPRTLVQLFFMDEPGPMTAQVAVSATSPG